MPNGKGLELGENFKPFCDIEGTVQVASGPAPHVRGNHRIVFRLLSKVLGGIDVDPCVTEGA